MGDAMPAKVRNALTLYRAALKADNVEIRLTRHGALQLPLPRRRPTLRQPARLRPTRSPRPSLLLPPQRGWRHGRSLSSQLRQRMDSGDPVPISRYYQLPEGSSQPRPSTTSLASIAFWNVG
jgi:hypothetical protein